MGEQALDFGPLADLELLNELLNETASYLVALKNDLEDANMSTKERMARNAELRARMENMKKDMNSNMGGMVKKMMGIFGLE